jgi:hypothetical protein
MTHPVWLAAIVTRALATLPGLAYASPPDETWIRGLYDSADSDDVVLLATSVFVLPGSIRPELEPLRRALASLTASTASGRIDFGLAVRAPRGPPASSPSSVSTVL